jgi:hypothetical protein
LFWWSIELNLNKMSGYTVYITYNLVSTSGFSKSIHCNYIKAISLNTTNPYIKEVFVNFPNIDDFKFLSNGYNETGFTANNIEILVQLVDNSLFTSTSDIKPDASNWKVYDVTTQTSGYTGLLFAANIVNTIYKVSLFEYDSKPVYNLNYLNYPVVGDENGLSFGDEVYFFGNVSTDIISEVYVTDLSIPLLLDQYNSSTNLTWDGVSPVAISEIGIYDENKNLIAVGKLNNPVTKDSTISRTIVFAIDF